jgi:predicted O-methyltransferase YrrM
MTRPDKLIARGLLDGLLARKESLLATVVWTHHPGEGRVRTRLDHIRVDTTVSVLTRGDAAALEPVLDAIRAAVRPHPELDWIEARRLAEEAGEVTLDSHGNEAAKPIALAEDRSYISAGERQGLFLFELARRLEPETILELGTAYGIGTLYLAAAGDARIVSVEGDPVRLAAAGRLFEACGLGARVEAVEGWFPDCLPAVLGAIDGPLRLVFEDGPHTADVTWPTFEQVVERLEPGGMVVIDDVYHRMGNEAAWLQVQQHEQVAATAEINGRQGVVVKRR